MSDPMLTIIWAAIIAIGIAAYVVMDGFDLGIGMLFPHLNVGTERNMAMNSIAPVWDGNETWLVLGGGGLLAAFPLAYAVILPALYAPLIAMLLGLVFRGVAFEFRWRDPGHRRFWDFSFFAGSLVATLAQGIALGALLQGIEVQDRAYAGGWWNWLTPFSLLCGAALVIGYQLLGACWLVMKTTGSLRVKARRFAKWLTPFTLLMIGAVSLATPFVEPQYFVRWFEWPGLAVTIPMPLLVLGMGYMLWRDLESGYDIRPFFWALGLFLLSMIGLGISIWPDVVPGSISIYEAAAPRESQIFMLVGAVILVPVVLGYTVWAYWIFRGKVDETGYH